MHWKWLKVVLFVGCLMSQLHALKLAEGGVCWLHTSASLRRTCQTIWCTGMLRSPSLQYTGCWDVKQATKLLTHTLEHFSKFDVHVYLWCSKLQTFMRQTKPYMQMTAINMPLNMNHPKKSLQCLDTCLRHTCACILTWSDGLCALLLPSVRGL